MGIGYNAGQGEQPALWAELLTTFACFMPAITATVTSLITKEKLKNLCNGYFYVKRNSL